MTENQKKRGGCLKTFGIVLVVGLLLVAASAWAVKTYVFPSNFKPVELSAAEDRQLAAKLGYLEPEAYRENPTDRKALVGVDVDPSRIDIPEEVDEAWRETGKRVGFRHSLILRTLNRRRSLFQPPPRRRLTGKRSLNRSRERRIEIRLPQPCCPVEPREIEGPRGLRVTSSKPPLAIPAGAPILSPQFCRSHPTHEHR